MYVVDRDFGFAPNPFHGYCSLATCKPKIRSRAEIGDWVIGMGGTRLAATGRCVYAMRVSNKITFDEYWSNPTFLDKKPIRNGSRKMMVGDNIYRFNPTSCNWEQADSHHSNADGSVNAHNLEVDTQSDKVLVSDHFFYFGKKAPVVPSPLLSSVGYKNGRNYRVLPLGVCSEMIAWLYQTFGKALNKVVDAPFDFGTSEKRYSVKGNKIS